MRTARILTILISLLAAPVAAANGLELSKLGVNAAQGSGHVNGSAMDVLVVTGSTLDELKKSTSHEYTVREVSEHGRRTLLVVNLHASVQELSEAAYVFSDVGGLLIGTPLGPLAKGLRAGPKAYQGSALAKLPDGAKLDVETGFTFGQAKVDTSTLTVRATPAMARSLFVESLVKAGFQAQAAPSESPAAQTLLEFRKGQTVVHLIVNAGDSGSETKVILHEVSVP